ncbi:MAG TPA: glycosyltransferase family 1 protein [Longimicrobiales bacterium]|nr:glycosyltransferase family 1 protein [Longimicrobiales bacterium]
MKLGVNGRFLTAPAGGVRRFAEEIARGVLAESGGILFGPAGPPADQSFALPSGTAFRGGRLRGHAWEQIELPAAARRAGCDVLLHLANTAPLRGGPHVATVHDVTPLTDPAWFRPSYVAWHRRVVRPALRRAAALLTVSGWSAGEMARVLDVDPERIRVVPQGPTPLDEPAADATVRAVRRRFGLPDAYLLAVGARDPRKNLAFLAKVRARLADEPGAVPLVVVGPTSRGRVWAAPPDPPSGEGIRHVGEVDDETLRALYTGASVLLHPALAEGFGRPPLEAMACGAPVVAAPYGPAREVLGDAAEVIPLVADAWAAAVTGILAESRDCRERRRERGRARAGRWRWEEGVERVLEVCRAVAGGRP